MTQENNTHISEEIFTASKKIQALENEIAKKIVWQKELIRMLIVWLFAEWHILLEGLPGLAKTRTISTFAQALDMGFSRIQFTPDLLPSDVIGAEIYNTKKWDFEVKKWPIFTNFLLADEINRAPSKVQSALLEAMAEKHITIGKETFLLERPFFVLATQNPIEQSGTYRLPEAQLDRFMFKVSVSYPSKKEEIEMYKKILSENEEKVEKILTQNEMFQIKNLAQSIYISESIYEYVGDIIAASREKKYVFSKYISYGVSPRWGLALLAGARVYALLEWRQYVIPEDIKYIAPYALSHRLVLSYEALADEVTSKDIVHKILDSVQVV